MSSPQWLRCPLAPQQEAKVLAVLLWKLLEAVNLVALPWGGCLMSQAMFGVGFVLLELPSGAGFALPQFPSGAGFALPEVPTGAGSALPELPTGRRSCLVSGQPLESQCRASPS